MIKIENTKVMGWEAAIRGMRNPMDSWEKSDSNPCAILGEITDENRLYLCAGCKNEFAGRPNCTIVGENDYDLMMHLAEAGPEHAKYRRMIVAYADVTAPLYWWKEYDTYKIGTVANSCSTMHKIHSKQFELADFSHEHLTIASSIALQEVIYNLNYWRAQYDLAYTDKQRKECWWQIIQMLPSSYNQRRTVMLNYEVLANIYRQRLNHKLDEWRDFCTWASSLPYSELITGKEAEANG